MAPSEPYRGPVALATSKHSSSRNNVMPASDGASQSKAILATESTATHTRRMLVLLHEIIKSESPECAKSSLETVSSKWDDLEKLFHNAQTAQSALPASIDDTDSVVTELINSLNDKQQKLEFTSEHTAESKPDPKIVELQERLSRLSLDRGTLQTELGEARKESARLRAELELVNKKYKEQSAEFAKTFTDLNEQTKKVNTLTTEKERFQAQYNKQTEKANARAAEKERLQEQYGKLEVEAAKAKGLEEELKKVRKEVDELETENNDLVAQQAKAKELATAYSALQGENGKLQATIEELQNKPTTSVDSAALVTMKQDCREWKELATVSSHWM